MGTLKASSKKPVPRNAASPRKPAMLWGWVWVWAPAASPWVWFGGVRRSRSVGSSWMRGEDQPWSELRV